MAKRITDLDEYDPITTSNPDGSLKERVYDTDGTTILEEGSQIKSPYVMDMLNVFHRAGRNISRFLSGVTDTQVASQFYDWWAANIRHGGSNYYEAVQTTSTQYTLTNAAFSPQVYQEGLVVRFRSPASNAFPTLQVNVAGLGWKDVANTTLAAGESPAVQSGSFGEGDIVALVYTVRPSDSFGYFKIVTTPLTNISDGTMFVRKIVGDVQETIQLYQGFFDLDKIEYQTGTSNIKKRWISRLNDALAYFEYRDNDAPIVNQMRVDPENGYLEASTYDGVDFLKGRIKGQGVNFQGGPNATDTEVVDARFYHYKVPSAAINFVASAGYPDDWYGNDPGGGSFSFVSGIGSAELVGQPVAHYRTDDGVVKCAPVLLIDASGGTRSGTFNIVVKSGDATIGTTKRPVPGTGNAAMTISFWYDGSGLS